MGGGGSGPDYHEDDWERHERTSCRIALAIALLPIPLALLIALALGDPPWQPRPDRREVRIAPAKPHRPAPGAGHSDR